jgi:hypothetical protein
MKSAVKTPKAVNGEALSLITKAMEKAHQIIKEETGAPSATILITRNLKNAKAHFTPYTPWKNGDITFNEIAFNAEYFNDGAVNVLRSLLHEVAHSLNWQNGIKDCSSNQYHNKNFALTAEALGLKTEKAPKIGFTATGITEEGLKRWDKALKVIDCALSISALSAGEAKPKGRNTNLIKAECGCGNVIRLSRTVLESGVICKACEEDFLEA